MTDQHLDRADRVGRPTSADLPNGLVDTSSDHPPLVRHRPADLAAFPAVSALYGPDPTVPAGEPAARGTPGHGRGRAGAGVAAVGPDFGDDEPDRDEPDRDQPDRDEPGEDDEPWGEFAGGYLGALGHGDAFEPPPAAAPSHRQRERPPGGRMPAMLRGVVWDPAARGAMMLALVALAAAAVAAFFAWHGRPVRIDTAMGGGAARVTASPGASPSGDGRAGGVSAEPGGATGTPRSASPAAVVVVDVAGRVREPGVVRLPAGSRVVDAIERVGGVLPGTDTTGLALARQLVDGEQILVDGRPGPASAAPAAVPSAGAGSGGEAGNAVGLVHLNTATAEQFDTLPGIGPVLADRIVRYRQENGPFASPEQLAEVPGVGDRRLAELLPLIAL